MNRRAVIVALVIVVLAAASTWLSRESHERAPPVALGPTAPDYFVENFVATRTGPDGQPRERIEADRMLHLPVEDVLTMEKPHLTVFRPGAPAWNIYASVGRIHDQGEQVHLQGEVRLIEARKNPIELDTTDLWVYPRQDYAKSDAPVTVTGPGSRIDAVGLYADMKSRMLTLLSKVRGKYEPSAP